MYLYACIIFYIFIRQIYVHRKHLCRHMSLTLRITSTKKYVQWELPLCGFALSRPPKVAAVALLTAAIVSRVLRRPLPKGGGHLLKDQVTLCQWPTFRDDIFTGWWFQAFLCLPLPGEMIQFDEHIFQIC